MKGKKLFIVGFLAVAVTMSVFLNSTFAKENFTPKEVTYDALREGDVIPFDSMLSIEAFFPIGTTIWEEMDAVYDQWKELFEKPSGLQETFNSIKLYYCKDESCLTNEKYDKEKIVIDAPYEDLGTKDAKFGLNARPIFHDTSEINVSNYQTIFEENDDSYVGWKVHFVDSGILYWFFDHGSVMDYRVSRVGNYQHIVLTPVKQEDCDCSDDEDAESEYYLEQEVDITTSSWYYKNVTNDYMQFFEEVDTNQWQKPASFTFEANKGDKLVVNLKMDTTNFKITLDSVEQKLLDEFYDDEGNLTKDKVNPNRYYEFEFDISADGQHTFTIEYLGDSDLYFPYIYMAELKVLKPVQIEEVSKGKVLEIKTCKNGFQMRIDHAIGMEDEGEIEETPEEKPNVPNTLDHIAVYMIIIGSGLFLILLGIYIQKKYVR